MAPLQHPWGRYAPRTPGRALSPARSPRWVPKPTSSSDSLPPSSSAGPRSAALAPPSPPASARARSLPATARSPGPAPPRWPPPPPPEASRPCRRDAPAPTSPRPPVPTPGKRTPPPIGRSARCPCRTSTSRPQLPFRHPHPDAASPLAEHSPSLTSLAAVDASQADGKKADFRSLHRPARLSSDPGAEAARSEAEALHPASCLPGAPVGRMDGSPVAERA
ncbi:uncharacterized protein [Gorilla gorilla gorilla]|uniref:uncharacterized protein n=1 Tax=Gorilla gorilla gorilla TaxID=9595 RepID=UPI00300B87A3